MHKKSIKLVIFSAKAHAVDSKQARQQAKYMNQQYFEHTQI